MHVATLRRDILGFLFIPLWLTTSTAVKDMLRNVHRHIQDWCFTWRSYLWKHSRKLLCSTLDGTGEKGNQAKLLMVRNWTSIWDAIRSIPAASPPHLRGRTRRDSNEKPAFIRDRLTPAREGSLGGTPVSPPPSRAERDASSRKKAMELGMAFFSLTDGS